MSRMNLIYDQYVVKEKLKNGTKYEKLAAIVYKVLEAQDVVIHDMRLSGVGKKTKHQIDIVIEKAGVRKRVLIECKDYANTVGISIIRDFHGAVHQIKPGEAIVVTTQGYTREAVNFADDENIKLAVLREFEETDWEGRIKEIHITIKALLFDTPRISFIYDENDTEKFKEALNGKDTLQQEADTRTNYFYDAKGNAVSTYESVLSPIINGLPRIDGQETTGQYMFDEVKYIYVNDTLIGMKGFDYSFMCYSVEDKSVVDAGGKIALLLLKYLDGSQEKIIFDQDISRWTFDKKGTVKEK